VASAGTEWGGLSDQDVVLRARSGQETAYRELIRRYERPVFALLFRMVRDRELAEDLAQETFVKALNAIESYRPEFKFSSWIFKIANNAAIDHLRRRELDTLSLDGSPHAETPEAMQATALGKRHRSTPWKPRSWGLPSRPPSGHSGRSTAPAFSSAMWRAGRMRRLRRF
jgi:hypothetical protein